MLVKRDTSRLCASCYGPHVGSAAGSRPLRCPAVVLRPHRVTGWPRNGPSGGCGIQTSPLLTTARYGSWRISTARHLRIRLPLPALIKYSPLVGTVSRRHGPLLGENHSIVGGSNESTGWTTSCTTKAEASLELRWKG